MDALRTDSLVLEPLVAGHAREMFEALRDPELYRYLDYGPPPSVEHLRDVYAQLESRLSPDGGELWLNWAIRPCGGELAGFVQATVAGGDAWIAYMLARSSWGRGYATEATRAMIDHLRTTCAVSRFLATVQAGNERSIRLLVRLGLRAATDAETREHDLKATERLFVL